MSSSLTRSLRIAHLHLPGVLFTAHRRASLIVAGFAVRIAVKVVGGFAPGLRDVRRRQGHGRQPI